MAAENVLERDSPAAEARSIEAAAAADRSATNLPIGYLRAFVTALVVAHHAVIAYHPAAPPAPASLLVEPRWWQAFPVVDSARSVLVALLVGWNDTFFMSLMFLLSGLFVAPSFGRKGAGSFLSDRLVRLGLPFLAAAALLAPLSYYPSYLQTQAPGGISGFVREWRSLGNWPAGPAWFLWVLLAFDALVAALFAFRPHWAASSAERLEGLLTRPARAFAALAAASAVTYLPLAIVFNPLHWTAVGPFTFQTSRLLHYGLYFVAGIVIGARGLPRTFLAEGGTLARRWPAWVALTVVAFVLATAAALAAFSNPANLAFLAVAGLGFVFCCAASSFALLAVFLRFARRRTGVRESLRANAYGVYLVHYPFASWLQYALLATALPALAKAAAVSAAALLLSWTATAGLRRLPGLRRVL